MTKRRVLKHAILMATALFLIASGSAYAFCWHMGRQIVCPPGVPDGSNSMYFDANGNAVFPGAGGITIPVAVGTLVTYTPPPAWTPPPAPAPAPPTSPTNVRPEFVSIWAAIYSPLQMIQHISDWNDVDRRNRLMHEQYERNQRIKEMAKEQERQDEEREKRLAKEKADEKERLRWKDRETSRLERQRNREDQQGKGLRDIDLEKLAEEFSNPDYLGDRSEYAGSGRGEGYGFSIGGREGQGQFVGNANNTAPASPLGAGIQASDAASSSVPGIMP